MSRTGRLTIRNGLPRESVTGGDLVLGAVADNAETLQYLVDQTGLGVLYKRGQEAVRAIGQEAQNFEAGTILNGNDIREILPTMNPIQRRIYEMSLILFSLRPNFLNSYNRFNLDGYNHAQALNKATDEFNILFRSNLEIVNLLEPDIVQKSFIMTNINDEQAANELISYIKFKQM